MGKGKASVGWDERLGLGSESQVISKTAGNRKPTAGFVQIAEVKILRKSAKDAKGGRRSKKETGGVGENRGRRGGYRE